VIESRDELQAKVDAAEIEIPRQAAAIHDLSLQIGANWEEIRRLRRWIDGLLKFADVTYRDD
jgi:uncharacterized coiled-coil protein SlyX